MRLASLRDRRSGLARLLLGAALLAPSVSSVAETVPLDARYAIAVAGVRIADLALVVTPAQDAIRGRLEMQAQGVAAVWSDARSRLATTMRRLEGAEPTPVRFEATHHKRDRDREIAIAYDASGRISALSLLNQGRQKASEVPEAMRQGTVDPLTALERLRRWLTAVVAGSGPAEVMVPIFDGRKRIDLVARYVGATTYPEATGRRVHELRVQLIGRFGFDPDDSFVQLPDSDSPVSLRVLVSLEDGLVPLLVDAPERRTAPVISLVRDCRRETCPPPGG